MSAPKFKVGDRVRVKDLRYSREEECYTGPEIGIIGQVLSFAKGHACYEIRDGGEGPNVYESEIELCPYDAAEITRHDGVTFRIGDEVKVANRDPVRGRIVKLRRAGEGGPSYVAAAWLDIQPPGPETLPYALGELVLAAVTRPLEVRDARGELVESWARDAYDLLYANGYRPGGVSDKEGSISIWRDRIVMKGHGSYCKYDHGSLLRCAEKLIADRALLMVMATPAEAAAKAAEAIAEAAARFVVPSQNVSASRLTLEETQVLLDSYAQITGHLPYPVYLPDVPVPAPNPAQESAMNMPPVPPLPHVQHTPTLTDVGKLIGNAATNGLARSGVEVIGDRMLEFVRDASDHHPMVELALASERGREAVKGVVSLGLVVLPVILPALGKRIPKPALIQRIALIQIDSSIGRAGKPLMEKGIKFLESLVEIAEKLPELAEKVDALSESNTGGEVLDFARSREPVAASPR